VQAVILSEAKNLSSSFAEHQMMNALRSCFEPILDIGNALPTNTNSSSS